MNQAQLEPFLQRIKADRDQRLAVIRQREAEERKQQRGQGYVRSRALQRETADRLRREQFQNRERRVSRARGEVRHRRWQELETLQQSITKAALWRMNQAWQQPSQQWVWCSYWLQAAQERAGEATMRLRLGEVDDVIQRQIEEWLTSNGLTWRIDAELKTAGLRIRWSDFELDGSLVAQQPHIAEAVLQRLAPLMPHGEQLNKNKESR